jgi:large subunit ribosomal protein L18
MKTKKHMRARRKFRIRAKVAGTAARPRMSVFRSNRVLYVQLIDDEKMVTIMAAKAVGATVANAKTMGASIAADAKKKGITAVVFDRGGFRYHGVVRALADAAREGGLTI